MARPRGGALLALAIVLGAALRWWTVPGQALNFDETATWYFARLPWADLVGPPARLEPNPPLFYAVAHAAVAALGGAPWPLRLPSVLAGVLCIPVSAFIARRLAGPAAGVAAAFLVATSTAHIYTSQDARAYSLLTLAALVAIAATLWLLDAERGAGPRRGLAWGSYAGACVAALSLHNTAVLLVGALNLVAAWAWGGPLGRPRGFAVRWVLVNAGVVAVHALWWPVLLQQAATPAANLWMTVPSLSAMRYAVMNTYGQPFVTVGQPWVDAAFVAAGLAGLVACRRRPGVAGVAVFVLLGVPAATWAISQVRPIMNGKTLLWLVPVFLVFVAIGCTRLRRLAVPAAAALVAVQLAASVIYLGDRPDERFADVVETLSAQARPGDAVYLSYPELEVPLDYFGWRPGGVVILAKPSRDSWFRSSSAQPPTPDRLATAPRIWLLTRSRPVMHAEIAGQLGQTMRPVSDRVFGHGSIHTLRMTLFERPGP